ncbi:MAG: GTPase HflX [Alphaproteobacteria bacterium]|nr:GTPase HflX [Alphaproteobacteria bacterium]
MSTPASARVGPNARQTRSRAVGAWTDATATTGRALVLHPILPSHGEGDGAAVRDPEARVAEAVGLARAIGLTIAHAQSVVVKKPRPATLMGSGTVEAMAQIVEAQEIGVVVVDGTVSPVQQRNLEKAWKAKVIDRTGLILEIFGARARTHEGALQVELAALSYQRSRLVRSWTHLERQRGGFGFLGGPGESQLEMDRRLIDERIIKLKRELEQVKRTRGLHRAARKRVPYPVVALVGYTNAGKSTLFNRLTRAAVMAEDLLFATLDPTMRRLSLPSGRTAILSDTVGFISNLPTQLVAAFRATLEEVLGADIIVHVRDVAHPDSAAQRGDVLKVLRELGLEALLDGNDKQRHLIEALNKIDLLDRTARATLDAQRARDANAVPLSAVTGEGCEDLLHAVDACLAAQRQVTEFDIPVGDGASIAWLYEHGEVLERRDGEDRVHLRVGLDPADLQRFERRRQERRRSGRQAG